MFFIRVFTATLIYFVFPSFFRLLGVSSLWNLISGEVTVKYTLRGANKPLLAPTLRSFCHFYVLAVPVGIRCHVICSSPLYLTPCHGLFQLSRSPGGANYKKPVGCEQWGRSCLQQLAVRLRYLVTFILLAPCFPLTTTFPLWFSSWTCFIKPRACYRRGPLFFS